MKVQLAPDELGALVRRREASELAVQDPLNFVLDDDLLRLVHLEVAVGALALASVAEGLRPERRHFV